jgi:hypothetical protein
MTSSCPTHPPNNKSRGKKEHNRNDNNNNGKVSTMYVKKGTLQREKEKKEERIRGGSIEEQLNSRVQASLQH